MPNKRFVIDCGSGDPFLPGRQVEKVNDQQVNLLESDGTILRKVMVKPIGINGVTGLTGDTTDGGGATVTALFIFDTSGTRVVGAVLYPDFAGRTSVWSARS